MCKFCELKRGKNNWIQGKEKNGFILDQNCESFSVNAGDYYLDVNFCPICGDKLEICCE